MSRRNAARKQPADMPPAEIPLAGTAYEVDDLVGWDEKIREKVEDFGLDCHSQEFHLCDHMEMLGYMAYSGMPSHYGHWSYGKSFEKLKTLYDYGVSGLPYEMVINSDPSLAYLMRGNTLCLQILTMAHVYGHNDFFKNNFTFRHTRADLVINAFKTRSDRVRRYAEDPSIGLESVEKLLDAAHGLSLQRCRNFAIHKATREEQEDRVIAAAQPQPDPYRRIHKRQEIEEPDLHKLPLEPDQDLLLFIRDHNPRLSEWEKDLLTIVDDQARYFIPQIETKIINEGWATFWHRSIMNSLDLPQDIHLEFLVRHNQVVRPTQGELNPYCLGLRLWDDIAFGGDGEDSYPNPGAELRVPDAETCKRLFAIREVDRDTSFLRRFLGEELMREMDLFEYEPHGDDLVITKVSDEDSWKRVKNTLINGVGTGSIPVIQVEDADHGGNRSLYLRHVHDGRDLQLEYAEKTLAYLFGLWGHDVLIETVLNEKKRLLSYGEQGFAMKMIK